MASVGHGVDAPFFKMPSASAPLLGPVVHEKYVSDPRVPQDILSPRVLSCPRRVHVPNEKGVPNNLGRLA